MTLSDTIANFVLNIRYKYFRNSLKPVNFGTPTFVSDFENDDFNISNGNKYSSNMITLKENVEVKNGILNLHCKPYNKEYSNWWGTKFFEWSTGWIDYSDKVENKWGTWSATMKLPKDAWPAFWLLRKRHWDESTLTKYTIKEYSDNTIFFNEDLELKGYLNWFVLYDRQFLGFIKDVNKETKSIILDRDINTNLNNSQIEIGPDHITPEVDVMEPMKKNGVGKTIIKHTIHYGYSVDEYVKRSGGPWICDADEEWHNYAVTISPTGYKFYIDNILTGVFTDPLSIEDIEAYPILNNAVHPNRTQENLLLQVKDLKHYEL